MAVGSHESKLIKHKVLNLSSCVQGGEKPSVYLTVMDVRDFGVLRGDGGVKWIQSSTFSFFALLQRKCVSLFYGRNLRLCDGS